jgi:hypothetical protein
VEDETVQDKAMLDAMLCLVQFVGFAVGLVKYLFCNVIGDVERAKLEVMEARRKAKKAKEMASAGLKEGKRRASISFDAGKKRASISFGAGKRRASNSFEQARQRFGSGDSAASGGSSDGGGDEPVVRMDAVDLDLASTKTATKKGFNL